MKYVRVMDGILSNATKYEFKLNEINVSSKWKPSALTKEEQGGFYFSNEQNILRWMIRGSIIYDVELPIDAEIIKEDNPSTPNGVFNNA